MKLPVGEAREFCLVFQSRLEWRLDHCLVDSKFQAAQSFEFSLADRRNRCRISR